MINIADKILVSLCLVQAGEILPQTTITPIGKSTNEKRKINLLKSRNFARYLELDNKPLPGFTLVKNEKHGWNSVNTYWVIIDPRGFTSTITSSNLEQILHCTGITEGLIQEKCVWAREDTRTTMVLLPTSSNDYIEAKKNTELLNNKVKKSEINLGDTVLLENKQTGVYWGSAALYGTGRNMFEFSGITTEMYGKREVLQMDNQFYFRSDLKIIKVVEPTTTPYTKIEAIEKIREGINSGCMFSSEITKLQNPTSIYSDAGSVKFASSTLTNDITYTYEEVNLDTARELFKKGYDDYDCMVLILEDSKGKKYLIDQPRTLWTKTHYTCTISSFPVMEIEMMNGKLKITDSERAYRKALRYNAPKTPSAIAFSSYAKYYQIVKHIKSEKFI